jgi:hypothetical protein
MESKLVTAAFVVAMVATWGASDVALSLCF